MELHYIIFVIHYFFILRIKLDDGNDFISENVDTCSDHCDSPN